MEEAERTAREDHCSKLLVISWLGTRHYYRKIGFELDGLNMGKILNSAAYYIMLWILCRSITDLTAISPLSSLWMVPDYLSSSSEGKHSRGFVFLFFMTV